LVKFIIRGLVITLLSFCQICEIEAGKGPFLYDIANANNALGATVCYVTECYCTCSLLVSYCLCQTAWSLEA